ncbi:uncharacterized protein LOC119608294 [Lucilia sericata]|uniref:uncharacterized protein LOC119608294 n=1 Tax=Lucilia sericata TaxID=13632 RepID=UPI0018A822F4|nr:uncharacterized protein LOC119608294 [Lucilia sericata]
MAQQDVVNEIKQNVQEKFAELKSAVMMREKLLLRQLEVINTTRKQQLQSGKREKDIDSNIEFLCDNEHELLAAIRNFGRYQLTNLNLALQDVYLKNEDYIKPSDDHETMFKGLNQSGEEGELGIEDEESRESIVVDFSRHKSLMEHNAKLMNESIINITLKEAKELIKQAKLKREQPVPPLNLEELDDEVESSIADVVSSLEQGSLEQHSELLSNNKYSQTQQQSTKQKRFKPKITINNCNGTINLRNIASLTINCTTEDNVQAQIPVRYPNQEDEEEEEASSSTNKAKSKSSQKSKTLMESLVSSSSNTECTSPSSTSNSNTPNSLSNYSSNNSSRSQSTKKPKSKKSHVKPEKSHNMENKPLRNPNNPESQDNVVESSSSSMANEVTCDFYNRLLNEIKKSINQQQRVRSKCTSSSVHSQATQQNADSSTSFNEYLGEDPQGRRLVLKNFENLKIILEAHSSGDEESFHPVQIEQWLAEIISDTDLEPMQNTDILEHSKIYNEETQET